MQCAIKWEHVSLHDKCILLQFGNTVGSNFALIIDLIYILDICQFLGTIALFRPVQRAPKKSSICDKKSQNRPKFRVLCVKKGTGLKKGSGKGIYKRRYHTDI